MVIKDWGFGAQSYPAQANYKYKLTVNSGFDPMFFPQRQPTAYGDLENKPGIRGQGGNSNTTPAYTPVEKIFSYHFIVQVPIVDGQSAPGNHFFDPSYGVTYPNAAGFEAQAVVGYAYAFPDERIPVLADQILMQRQLHVTRPVPGVPNILFTVRFGL